MKDILKKLELTGIIPVIKIDNVEDAVPLAKALCDGGLPCAEITFRTDAAEESIRRISKELPDMLVGAGTVLTTEQVDRAINAGAKFIVSPGLNPTVVKYCQEKGILITPGCATPSDIEQAIELGLEVVKFFPAEANGGIKSIKAMAAPYTKMRFIPTGGINAKNLNDYLSFPKIVACGGSWMVDASLINAGDFAAITKLTREAVGAMLGFSIKHVGVYCDGDKEAQNSADILCRMLGVPDEVRSGNHFLGDFFEILPKQSRGTKGHIGIAANYVERAAAYLESIGFKTLPETASYNDKGQMTFIYLETEVAGFAFHLSAK